MSVQLAMASVIVSNLLDYIEEYGDMPVVLAVASAEEAVSMVQSDAVVTVSYKDSTHTENWIVLADFNLNEAGLDKALNPKDEC